jgi:hypothetical protein
VNVSDKQKKLAAGALILVAITWWCATSPESPVRPKPARPERPVLKALAKVVGFAARFGLAAFMFMEPAPTPAPPETPDSSQTPPAEDVKLAGADGYQLLRNDRW